MNSKIAIFSLLIFIFIIENSAEIVKVKQGLISGGTETLKNGKVVHRFLQVPFAEPPVGSNRFNDPVPLKTWPGVWNATNEKFPLFSCMQWFHAPGGNKLMGYEDCLYLNIYTPKLPMDCEKDFSHMDVIVFVHGGAFMFGTAFLFQPHSLLERHDLVFVNINYRLGPLGFLSTGDSVVPGNMGLKDQTEALKWVKENIAQFGGNPNKITLAGLSAGGSSVHFQMLSPQSKDLFQRAISMSGTALNPWTIAENLPEKTKFIANEVGCPTATSEIMIECLRHRPATVIVNLVQKMQPFLYTPISPFGVSIDSYSKNPFLPDHPKELLKEGKVADIPWLTSVTSSEGLYPAAEYIVQSDFMKNVDSNWTKVAPHILEYNYTVNELEKDTVAEKIRQKYMGEKTISKENFKPFIQMISDRLFVTDAEKGARFQVCANKISPVYFYVFNFRGKNSVSKIFSLGSEENFGVSHGDDTQYALDFLGAPEKESEMVDFMTNLWSSFANTGKPHISSWDPVTKDSFNYLKIESAEDYKMVFNETELGFRSFWDSLPINENTRWESNSTLLTKH